MNLQVVYSYKETFTANEGSIANFARSYKKFGLNINQNGDLVYREWAPQAKGLSLVSDYVKVIKIVWRVQRMEQGQPQVY